jgi:hypothetical protein
MIDNNSVSLRDYLESKIDGVKELFSSKFESLEKATRLVADDVEKRFDSHNEFRGQLKDQASTFITRTEYQSTKDKTESEINELKSSRDILIGKASQKSVTISYIIGSIGIIIALISLINNLVK